MTKAKLSADLCADLGALPANPRCREGWPPRSQGRWAGACRPQPKAAEARLGRVARAVAGLLLAGGVLASTPGSAQASTDRPPRPPKALSSPWSIALPPDPSPTSPATGATATPGSWTCPGPASSPTGELGVSGSPTGEPGVSGSPTGEPSPSSSPSASSSAGEPGDAAGPVLHVAPDGDGDGSSWDDAAGLQDLPGLVEELDGGGQVWLRGDAGAYRVKDSIALAAGGSDGEPVVVRGVDEDGDPDAAEIESDRADPYEPDGERGSDVLELRDGADHLVFRDLAFSNVGAAFTVAGPIEDLTVEQVTADNVRYFLTNINGGSGRDGDGDATVSGLVIRHVDVDGFSKSVLMLRYDSHDVLVQDVAGDSQGQDGDDFAMGVSLKGSVHAVVLRRVRMDNSVSTQGGYWNGDGFAAERDVDDVLLQDTSASGSTDAGYDLKSSDTRLVDAQASGNKRNFRFWSDVEGVRLSGQAPSKRGGSGAAAQVWLAKGADVTLADSELLDSGDLVVEAGTDAQLEMTGGRITQPDDGELARTEQGADVELVDVDFDGVDAAGPVAQDR